MIALALPACVREPQLEPPRSPDEPLILPSWAEAEPRAATVPGAARQRETITLGASDAPGRTSAGHASDAQPSSTQYKFPANDTWGPYRPLYYRSMPQTYTSPGAGTSTGSSHQSPVGRDWPSIPDHGPKMPATTPVHP